MKRKSKYFKVTAVVLSTSLLFACSKDTDSTTIFNSGSQTQTENLSTIGDQDISTVISNLITYDNTDNYTDWENENPTYITLNGTDAGYNGSGAVMINGSKVTIRSSGVYVVSAKLTDGQIHINAEDKGNVRLILNGVEINSSNTAPIYFESAEKTIISLPEGTENTISDGQQYIYEDSSADEPNAAIFSKDDLTINGTGKLTVHGNYNNGITSKNELRITGGNIEIHAVDDGLMGRDIVGVKEGNITIEAGGDGIKSSNDKDTTKGNIALEGGIFDITAAKDGMQAEASLLIADGTYTISSGGGNDGSGMDMQSTDTENNILSITGGYVTVNAEGDGLDSNGSFYMTDGTVLVNGPTMDGNGPLDYAGSFEISGGFLIAAGSRGGQRPDRNQATPANGEEPNGNQVPSSNGE